MSIKHRIATRPGFVQLVFSGALYYKNVEMEIIKIWAEVAQTCMKEKVSNVVAVHNFLGSLQILQAYNIANRLESFGWNCSWRSALVFPNPEEFKTGLFIATVAVNRGYMFKAFRKESSALSWLGLKSIDQNERGIVTR